MHKTPHHGGGIPGLPKPSSGDKGKKVKTSSVIGPSTDPFDRNAGFFSKAKPELSRTED